MEKEMSITLNATNIEKNKLNRVLNQVRESMKKRELYASVYKDHTDYSDHAQGYCVLFDQNEEIQ